MGGGESNTQDAWQSNTETHFIGWGNSSLKGDLRSGQSLMVGRIEHCKEEITLLNTRKIPETALLECATKTMLENSHAVEQYDWTSHELQGFVSRKEKNSL